MAETKSTSVWRRKLSFMDIFAYKKGVQGVQRVFGGTDSSHRQKLLTLLTFTGQLVFKLVCYISIKPYIMIGFTTRKKTKYPYASQTPIIVQHKQ